MCSLQNTLTLCWMYNYIHVQYQYSMRTKAFKSDSLVPRGGGGGGGDCYILPREKGCTGAKPGHPKPEQEIRKGQKLDPACKYFYKPHTDYALSDSGSYLKLTRKAAMSPPTIIYVLQRSSASSSNYYSPLLQKVFLGSWLHLCLSFFSANMVVDITRTV